MQISDEVLRGGDLDFMLRLFQFVNGMIFECRIQRVRVRVSESDSNLSRNLGMIHLGRTEQLVGHTFMGLGILENRCDDASLIGDGNRGVPASPKWKANDSGLDHRRIV